MSVCAILVIYNKRLEDSQSFQFIAQKKKVRLFVVDNSTAPNSNEYVAQKAHAQYISMGGNKGLAKAYNAALNQIMTMRSLKNQFVVLLDDDTILNDQYWDQIMHLKEEGIYLPIVKSQSGQILSPAEMASDIAKPIFNVNTIQDITGINSGMAVPLSYFKTIQYDTRLFLDYVDHQFLKDAKKQGYPIYVMPAELTQPFSAHIDSTEALLRRFEIFKKDSKVFYADNPKKGMFVVNKRRLHLMWKLKRFV